MATTGLWPVKTRLKEVIAYADNPDKTANPKYADNDLYSVIKYAENGDKTDKQLFISSINCPRQRAYECMMATKRRFGKTGGIAAYHGFQSFRQGEVTPEEAHQIGIETAKRMWGDKYEVVITTHLDHESHYHNHFVANSVSRIDGTRFQNHHYDHLHLREISDAVCAEHGKSVLKGSSFWGHNKGEYRIHKQGKKTHRDVLKEDVDYCLKYSGDWRDFERQMEGLGYVIDWTRMSIRSKTWERSVRLTSLGYNIDTMSKQMKRNGFSDDFFYEWNSHLPYKPRRFPLEWEIRRLQFTVEHSYDTATVLVDTMLLILIETFDFVKQLSDVIILSPDLRSAAKDIEQYRADYHFLKDNGIHTILQLKEVISDTKEQITAFENERSKADNIRRRAHNPDEVKAAKDKRKAITEKIDPLRKKLKHAEKIMERSPHLYELLQQEHSLEKTAMRKFEKNTGSLNKTNA